jgi:hypothetical protein
MWNQWAVQILVLTSFSLQVFLFLVGGTRRRGSSTGLRVLLWLAYLTADTVATYTLGHLAITSGSHLHQLSVFWAPFLLLHLGGQDTITAYALEDNRLWLRHLQTLVLQFLGVAYVLYRCLSGSWGLVTAAILMFILGAAKYGDRIWALKCADNIGIDGLTDKYCHKVLNNRYLEVSGMEEEEMVKQGAHILLSICVSQFNDCTLKKTTLYQYKTLEYLVGSKKIYSVIEMELSLMYDMMYTKAGVIHTWYGHGIRLFSVITIVHAFVQFRFFINKDGYRRVDVYITYILVVGAFVLEMTSWIMALGSTWARHFLYIRGWNRLYRVTVSLRRLVNAVGWRMWSGNVGQFNLFKYAQEHASMDMHKLKDLAPPVHISAPTKDLVVNMITMIVVRHGGEADGLYSLNQKVENCELPVLDCDFDTRIIIWHIATHAILLWIKDKERQRDDRNYEKAIKTLSNYMVFLLVKHPEMLVAHTSRQLCLEALNLLKFVDTNGLAEYLSQDTLPVQGPLMKNDPCVRGMALAKSLVGNEWERHHLLEVVFGAWVVMLCYAGSHCNRDSHARRLSSGGEFLTIVWQLAGHLSHYEREKHEQGTHP